MPKCSVAIQENAVATWHIGPSIRFSAALTSCLAAPVLPLWPPLTSLGPNVTAWDVLCSRRGVCICLSSTVLSCIYIWALRGQRPQLMYIGREEEFPLCPPSPRICCQSVSVSRLWSSRACLRLPSQRQSLTAISHWFCCSLICNLFASNIMFVWYVSPEADPNVKLIC